MTKYGEDAVTFVKYWELRGMTSMAKLIYWLMFMNSSRILPNPFSKR